MKQPVRPEPLTVLFRIAVVGRHRRRRCIPRIDLGCPCRYPLANLGSPKTINDILSIGLWTVGGNREKTVRVKHTIPTNERDSWVNARIYIYIYVRRTQDRIKGRSGELRSPGFIDIKYVVGQQCHVVLKFYVK